MHILLLSANTGEGHNSTSKALAEVFQEQGHTTHILDTLSYLSPSFSKFISNGHKRIYRYAPKLFNAGYGALERRTAYTEEMLPIFEILRLGCHKLYRRIQAEDYDAVICVHPFAGIMMTEVRRVYETNVPCFFVCTDYTCSPTVEQCHMDAFFIPHETLCPEFTQVGLPQNKLLPYGIPVRQAFYQAGARTPVRSQLGLPAEGCIILLMAGSMGCGPIEKIAKNLCSQLPAKTSVVAICGSNDRLRENLLQLQLPGLKVLGYTNQMSDYMDAADMIITKPGGLSSTEAANKHLPMVFINAVGGCESRNFDFFLDRGMAVGSSLAEEVVHQAVALAMDADKRGRMRQALAEAFTINSAVEICGYVCQQAQQYRQAQQENSDEGIETETVVHPISTKGGDTMDYQKLTLQNLARAFAGESQARTRYTIYAGQARQEGLEWIAQIFEQTAANETAHAEEFLEQLQKLGACQDNIPVQGGYPFQLGSTADNLAFAAAGELDEHDNVYPEFAEIARREGYADAARLFALIARVEGVHHNTFRQLADQMMSGNLAEKDAPVLWRCENCGHTYESTRAADTCPICGKGAGWQAPPLDEKQLMEKKNY